MTKENIEQYWPLLEGFRAGKTIQISINGVWEDFENNDIIFSSPANSYRVKPEAPAWFKPGRYVKLLPACQPLKIESVDGDMLTVDGGVSIRWNDCIPGEFRPWAEYEIRHKIPFGVCYKEFPTKTTTVLSMEMIQGNPRLYLAGNGPATIAPETLAAWYVTPDGSPCGVWTEINPLSEE